MFDSLRCRIELVSTTVSDCYIFHSVSGRGLGLGTEAKQPHDCHKFRSLLNWVPGDFAHSKKRRKKKRKKKEKKKGCPASFQRDLSRILHSLPCPLLTPMIYPEPPFITVLSTMPLLTAVLSTMPLLTTKLSMQYYPLCPCWRHNYLLCPMLTTRLSTISPCWREL